MSLELSCLYPKVQEVNEEKSVERDVPYGICGNLLDCCNDTALKPSLEHKTKQHRRAGSFFLPKNTRNTYQQHSSSFGYYSFLNKMDSDLSLTEYDNQSSNTIDQCLPEYCTEVLFKHLYALTRRIFRCQQSHVWECIERKTGNRYCVKVFDIQTRTIKQAALHESRFLRLAQGHPAVLQWHETIVEPSKLFLVTELVTGSNLLTKIVQDGSFSSESTKGLISLLFDGINHLREQRIAHNNLQPSNILFTSSGSIKICDFGSASHIGECRSVTCEFSPYCAPEARRISEGTSDIWSAGMILYFSLYAVDPIIPLKSSRLFLPGEKCPRTAKQLIISCINPDPHIRLTGEEALAHPFLCSHNTNAKATDARLLACWSRCVSFLRNNGKICRKHYRMPSGSTIDSTDSSAPLIMCEQP